MGTHSQPSQPGRVRLFVAVPLEPALLRRVQAEQQRLQTKFGTHSIRWTAPEQLHLTLKFFGNVAWEQIPSLQLALRHALVAMRAFELTVADLGCFPSYQNPKVVWFGLGGSIDRLSELQGKVEIETRGFGNHSEERAFHPHLTVGRVKALGAEGRRLGQSLRAEPPFNLGRWQVTRLQLIQSQLRPQGSLYTVMAELPLEEGLISGFAER